MDLSRIAMFAAPLFALVLMIATPTQASVRDDASAEARLLQDSAEGPAIVRIGAAGAIAGVADDELLVGQAYDWGLGLPRNDQAAAQWYGRAASHGSVKAMVEFAVALENGTGVTADPARAVALYRVAAGAGSAAAETRLGMALQWGHGVARDPCAAATHYRRAAQQGEAMALVYETLQVPPAAHALDCTPPD